MKAAGVHLLYGAAGKVFFRNNGCFAAGSGAHQQQHPGNRLTNDYFITVSLAFIM